MRANESLGEPPSQEAIDPDVEAPAPTQQQPTDATEDKNKADGSASGKRERAASKEEGGTMGALTEVVWGFAGVVKQTIHAERGPRIVKAVLGCRNFTKTQLIFCLDHLMECKRFELGFLDMNDKENDLCLTNHLTMHDLLY